MDSKINTQGQSTNVWDYKPWWCQPWSILLTGIILITGSWVILKILWITILVALPICLWWIYFLIFYPQMIEQLLTEQLKKDS